MDSKDYYICHFMNHLINNGKSQGTLKTYKLNIYNFIEYYKGTYSEEFIPEKVIVTDFQDWNTYQINRFLKASTINNRISSVKEYFLFLESNKIIEKNPAKSLKKIKINNSTSVPTTFTLVEFKTIKRRIYKEGNPLDILLLELFSKTGVRISEACDIKLSDFTISDCSGELRIIGKETKERVLPLHVDVRKAIHEYLMVRNKKFKDSPYLLVSEKKCKFTKSGLYKRFLKYQHLTNIKIHPHSFRFFFATQLTKTTPLHVCQKLLGHANISTTQKYLATETSDLISAIDNLKDL